jgi:selenocysteine-specific elongation factor
LDQKDRLFRHTIGIAGHIDHGKTTLTKRLTGVDTDRLKEEKERGISIEPGYAPCILPGGAVIGVVDVPGHERFIRQMIAGAAGIDMVLLVIAADEGVMPQTREHVDILRFLGIKAGIIVLTKCDAVEEDWLAMVQEEVAEWAGGTFLRGAPMVTVSGKTGAGIDLLRTTIEQQLISLPQRKSDAPVRIPIDRVFKVKGAGTVVTGTVYEGKVAEGDVLQLLPGETKVRVRQLHVHKRQVAKAVAGERVAVNISGGNADAVCRGMTLAAPGYSRASKRIDVRFSLLESISFGLRQRTRVRLHLGTSEVIGKIVFFDRNLLEPGEETVCQLQLEEPVVTKQGEPFVIRRLSPMMTIGGGQVIDPYAQRHRFGQATVQRLNQLAEGSLQEQLVQYLERVSCATVGEVLQHVSVGEAELRTVLQEAGQVFALIGRDGSLDKESCFLLLAATREQWNRQIVDELAKYHQTYPLRAGMDKALLKSSRFSHVPDKLWRIVLEQARQHAMIQETNNTLCLTGFTPGFPSGCEKQMQRAVAALEQNGWHPSAWGALLQEFAIPEELGGDFKAFLLNRGELVHLADDLYLHRAGWVKGVDKLRMASSVEGVLTPAAAKEALGLSRKYLIPFLESLDREKLTRRVDTGRIWRG